MDAVATGLGSVVALTGEPGIGKTRLAEETMMRATARGWTVAWGSGWPDVGSPPMWPWQDILEQLGRDDASLLLDTSETTQELDPERFTRFRAVTSAIAEAAKDKPLLVVLDDAHASDASGLMLARFAARSLRSARLLLLITFRGDNALPAEVIDALRNLLREGTTIDLTRLGPLEVSQLFDWAGQDHQSSDVAEVLALSGGNPLLTVELLAHADRGAGTGTTSARDRAQRSLSERLVPFDGRARTVLAAGALLGPSVSADVIAAVADVAVNDVEDVRRRGVEAGLLCAEPHEEFVFAHGLLRDTLLEAITRDEVVELHSRAADALARLPSASTVDRLVRVAHHRLAAAEQSTRADQQIVSAAIEASRAAAMAVQHRLAYEAAAELLRAARRLEERSGAAPTARLLLELAQAELASGRLWPARDAFEAAIDAADAHADPELYAEAAIGLGGIWVFEHRDAVAVQRFHGALRRALAEVGSNRPDLAVRLRIRLAAEQMYLGQGTIDDAIDALDDARSLGDPAALSESLSLFHHLVLGPVFAHERLTIADELITVASANGDAVLSLMGVLWRTVDLFLLGHPTAERGLTELRQRADALRVQAVLYIVSLIDVLLLMRAGRLDEAEAAAEQAFNLGLEVGDADAAGYFGAQLFAMRWLQGRTEEILPMARDITASPSIVALDRAFPASYAALAANSGPAHFEEARKELDKLVKAGLGSIPTSSNWLLTMFAVAEAAARLDEQEAAAAAYEQALPFADLPTIASIAVVCFGSTERTLGLAARTIGRLDDAVAHLERAIEADRHLGNRPMLAVTRADLALTLLRRGREGDRARAQELLRNAIDALNTMGLERRAAMIEADAALLDTVASASGDASSTSPGRSMRYAQGAWQVVAGNEAVVVLDSAGMRHLARLLASPGRDIAAADLAGTGVISSRQEVVDQAALASYGRRIEELRRELDEADERGDHASSTALHAELDQLVEHVEASMGLGTRARAFADAGERARTAVQKAIRRAIARIKLGAPGLADELSQCVRTGTMCRYDPLDGGPDDEWVVVGPP
jgi:tetratricopeptide (TPR) repeat protein